MIWRLCFCCTRSCRPRLPADHAQHVLLLHTCATPPTPRLDFPRTQSLATCKPSASPSRPPSPPMRFPPLTAPAPPPVQRASRRHRHLGILPSLRHPRPGPDPAGLRHHTGRAGHPAAVLCALHGAHRLVAAPPQVSGPGGSAGAPRRHLLERPATAIRVPQFPSA